MSTFVSVGNATQPFPRLLDAVAHIAAQLPQPVIIQYGAATGFHAPFCQCTDYFGMQDFEGHIAAAELLILHAGAGSVIHAVRDGKVPVVVARCAALGEHVDNHQQEFSRELMQLGKVVVCQDTGNLLACAYDALHRQKTGFIVANQSPLVAAVNDLLQEHAKILASKRDLS